LARFLTAEEAEDTAFMAVMARTIVTRLGVQHRDRGGPLAHRRAGDAEAGRRHRVAKMKVLIESVEHHTGEEETEMFPHPQVFRQACARRARAPARDDEGPARAPTAADKEHFSTEELKALMSRGSPDLGPTS